MPTHSLPHGIFSGLCEYPRSVLAMWRVVSHLARYDSTYHALSTCCVCDDEAGTVTVVRNSAYLTYRQQSDGTWREDPFICLDEDRLPTLSPRRVTESGPLSGVRRLVDDFLRSASPSLERSVLVRSAA